MAEEDRRLAAIISADIVGYSRLMEQGDRETLSAAKQIRHEYVEPNLKTFDGRIVNTAGDSYLLEFRSAAAAVGFAIEFQLALAARNEKIPADKQIVFRLGVNLGDVIVDGTEIHGDGVNVAARLQSEASPGGVNISNSVYEVVRGRLGRDFVDAGEFELRNISRPVHVWRWVDGATATSAEEPARPPQALAKRHTRRLEKVAKARTVENVTELISRHRDELLTAAQTKPFIVFLCGPTLSDQTKPSAQLRARIKDALEADRFEVVLGEDDGLEDSRLDFGVNAQDNELEFISTSCNAVVVIADSVGSFCEVGLFSWHFVHEGGLLNKTRRRTEFILLVDKKYEGATSYFNEGPARAIESYGIVWFVDFATFDVAQLLRRIQGQRGVMIVDNKRGRPRKAKS